MEEYSFIVPNCGDFRLIYETHESCDQQQQAEDSVLSNYGLGSSYWESASLMVVDILLNQPLFLLSLLKAMVNCLPLANRSPRDHRR
jgi:hypothetical protein